MSDLPITFTDVADADVIVVEPATEPAVPTDGPSVDERLAAVEAKLDALVRNSEHCRWAMAGA